KQLAMPTGSFTFNGGAIDVSGKPTTPDPVNPVNGASGGTITVNEPLTLDATRTMTLAGSGGTPGTSGQGNGGNGGTLNVDSSSLLTLNGGTLNLSGGNGSSVGAAAGSGGAGGTIVVLHGGHLNLVSGTINISGGTGSPAGAGGAISLND